MTAAGRTIQQLVNICRQANYFATTVTVDEGGKRCNRLELNTILPFGKTLLENIRTQWERSLVGGNAHLYSEAVAGGVCREDFINLHKKSIPFSLAENDLADNGPQITADETKQFRICVNQQHRLTCTHFINEKNSKDFFYDIQRKRKIWWMKIASNPGRFLLSETKTLPCKTMITSLLTEFPFGQIELERFELIPFNTTSAVPVNSADSKHSTIVRTTIHLETVGVATILDAIDSAIQDEISLNCKLVPYHYGIVALDADGTAGDRVDFLDLAMFCRLLIEGAGMSVLLEKAATEYVVTTKAEVDEVCDRMDKFGVPYVLILNAESLKTGMIRLRSRDTTLAETIHLSDIPEYLTQLVGRWKAPPPEEDSSKK